MPAAALATRSALAAALAALALSASPLAGADAAAPRLDGALRLGALARANATPAPRLFAPNSIWNAAAPRGARTDPASRQLAAALAAEARRERASGVGPSISTSRYGVPIYTVPAGQPEVRVQLNSPTPAPALQAAFERVPLPPEARPSGGTDANLVVWQPATDRLWEFWRLTRTADGPSASWGGAIDGVSGNRGVYGPDAWPGAKPWWGSSASSLSIAGGLITVADLRAGRIDHALALAIPAVRAGVFALPAQRSDGASEDPLSLPEGARLRLDPRLDLEALQLPRTTRLIAEAAQRYGIYVRDGASVIHFFAQDPVNLGRNPYAGPNGYFDGRYPGELLASFPWERLEVLEMELRADE